MGDSWGCNDLALFYRDGISVAADRPRAEELFAKSCKGGDGLACHNLAQMVMSRDPKRASALKREACKKGHKSSCR
jgi:TPR repeat protein